MIRHLKDDVKDCVKLLGYEEKVEWVELTKAERNIYNSKTPNKNKLNSAERTICQNGLLRIS